MSEPGRAGADPARAEGGWLLASGLAALALAATGEAVFRTGRPSLLGWAAFAAAAPLLAFRAWPLPPRGTAAERLPERRWLLLAGVAAALALNAALLVRLARGGEPPGVALLWLAAPALLVVAARFAAGATAIAPRWEAHRWPGLRTPATLAAAAIVAVAAAARFPSLGTVPPGIYPDEGDMAALSVQILDHTDATPLFGFGWYYLGMPYFRLMAATIALAGEPIAGARLLSAIAGFLTVPLVLALAARHFGVRAGLAAGALLAVLGPALQFSRLVTNAAPTALLFTLAAAGLLEAARRGLAGAWACAGVAGGLALYFYPSGRLWGLQAALFVAGLLAVGPRGSRGRTLAGAAVGAAAAFVVMSPFVLRNLESPYGELTLRYRETTVFLPENAARLEYWRPGWSLPRLVAVQLDRSLALFDRVPDQNSFWPTREPILGPALAALVLLGLGAVALRPRDPRLLLLSLWFWTGFAGVVVTVETPNFHRMATAVPVLALLAALVVDEAARRLERPSGPRAAGLVAAGAVVLLAAREATFYFTNLGGDAWLEGVREGEIVASHPGSWVVTLGRRWHFVASGWVRVLAPDANRAGLLSPGRHLPPRVPADRGLAFVVLPDQRYYLPLLEELVPGGRRVTDRHDPPDLRVTRYEVSREAWRASLARRRPPAGLSCRIVVPRRLDARRLDAAIAFGSLGDELRTDRPFHATWEGTLRAPVSGTYAMALVTPCVTRLFVDGRLVLAAAAGADRTETTLALDAGPHDVRLASVVVDPGELEWTWTPPGGPESIVPPSVLTPRDPPARDDPRVAGRAFTLVW